MILQALNAYYQRKQSASPGTLAPEGFEFKEIPFVVVLSEDGRALDIEDTRTGDGKVRRAKRFIVPKSVRRTVGVAANLLWDNAEYALGLACAERSTSPERLQEQHQCFAQRVRTDLAGCEDTGLRAVLAFLESDDHRTVITELPLFAELRATNPNLSFRLAGEHYLIAERPNIVATLQARSTTPSEGDAIRCLVTGKADRLARLHPVIKGVWGAQSSGASIVSFNLPAFTSFGRDQGANAPVGEKAAFAYTEALNALLSKDSKQRVQVGDASTVFWAAKAEVEAEGWMALVAQTSDDPDADAKKIDSLYASVRNGAYVRDDGDTSFYVLGLAPNAARVSVRFWHSAPVREVAVHIERWFRAIEIQRPSYEAHRYPSLFVLLRSIAVVGKADNIPPRLGGDTLRAILEGRALPANLLQAAVLRCRAEQQVPYARAALIKACLNLRYRPSRQLVDAPWRMLTVALDLDNKDPAYRLGRLFAALEKTQLDANPGLNASIRERYYGAASAAPASVFPLLLRLKNHHLAKLEAGRKVTRERLFGEIADGLPAKQFPSRLALPDQGLFAIGYYHQMQHFFVKKPDQIEASDILNATEDPS
jgi:CRISPR-associated protein Csd1